MAAYDYETHDYDVVVIGAGGSGVAVGAEVRAEVGIQGVIRHACTAPLSRLSKNSSCWRRSSDIHGRSHSQ